MERTYLYTLDRDTLFDLADELCFDVMYDDTKEMLINAILTSNIEIEEIKEMAHELFIENRYKIVS